MSFKVYHAWKWNGTLEELVFLLKQMKKEYREKMVEVLSSFSGEFLFMKEQNYFLKEDTKLKDLDPVQLALIIERAGRIGEYDPLNIAASAVIYPYNGDIYLQIFGLPNDWKYDDRLEEFSFSDQTGYPEDDDEYQTRKNIWEEIMKENDIPAEAGLIFELSPIPGVSMSMFTRKVLQRLKEKE